jgi:anti-anti-sigma factor
MDMQIDDIEDVTYVTLNGRLDTAGVSLIETRFFAAVLPKGRPTVLDLGEVPFLASLGVRMLISAARTLSQKGGRLVICNVTPEVMEVIEMTSLHEIVPTVASKDEAVTLARG